jgi:hypothetical protein
VPIRNQERILGGWGPTNGHSARRLFVLRWGNRVRHEMYERTDGRTMFKLLISDGMRWWWHDKGSPPHLVNKKPGDNLSADFLTALARTGFSLPTAPLPPVEAVDSKERFLFRAFSLDPRKRSVSGGATAGVSAHYQGPERTEGRGVSLFGNGLPRIDRHHCQRSILRGVTSSTIPSRNLLRS